MEQTAARANVELTGARRATNKHGPRGIEIYGLFNYRMRLGESIEVFWSRYGIREHAGRNYERGFPVPFPTAMLVALHAKGVVGDHDLARIREQLAGGLVE